MQYRKLGKTGFKISEISLGTWQVGGKWGSAFNHKAADEILHTAMDRGVNFIDTADVYSAGLSERAVGKVVKERYERIFVATKCGRQINPHVNKAYTAEVLRQFVEDSLTRTGFEILDLVQLHCPPPEVYYRPEIFGLFEDLKAEGKIRFLGVSVEKVEEGLKALQYENVCSVQIIFNMFRQRPAELFFKEAAANDVGIIVRVPLASGLLTGLYNVHTTFGEGDHRNFNREGAAFDKGETFSGIPYGVGLQAVDALKRLFPGRENLAPTALQWILQFPEVSCIIPGASKVDQVHSNLSVHDLDDLNEEQLEGINRIYKEFVKPHVHQLW